MLKLVLSLNQRTPLHVAARHGHKDIVEYLVGKVPDIDVNCEDYKKVSI